MTTALLSAITRQPGAQGRGHDRRDHPARQGAAHRRHQGESAGRPPRRHQDGDPPGDNEKDLEDIPRQVQKGLKFRPVKRIEEALAIAVVNGGMPVAKKTPVKKEARREAGQGTGEETSGQEDRQSTGEEGRCQKTGGEEATQVRT